MKKVLLSLCYNTIVRGKGIVSKPTVKGIIGAGEYANTYNAGEVNNYYLTRNATTLFVAVDVGNATNDAINFYVNANPISVVNGGTNTDGTLTGTSYDQTTASLPFRANFRAFVKSGYNDFVTANGSGG